MSPRREAQVRAARLAIAAKDRTEAANQAYRDKLKKLSVLSEQERRWYWNGCKAKTVQSDPEPTNRAKECRDWLTRINQVPDWSLIIDSRGQITGRLNLDAETDVA